MRIDRIALRGITTFRDVQALDLSEMGPGLIAVAGPNGAGKTSMLESIPGAIYRQTPSRGAVAALATARDAQIEIQGVNGQPFTVRLDIDAHTGKSEAVLIDCAGAVLAGPKVTAFDKAIAERFAPFNVYMAAAFSSQTGAGSLLKMERSARRELFGRLLGIERLEEIAGAARDRARKAESEIVANRAALDAIRDQAEDVAELERKITESQRELEDVKAARQGAEAALEAARQILADLDLRAAEANKAKARLYDAKAKVESKAKDAGMIEQRIAALGDLLAKAAEIRKVSADIKTTEAAMEQTRAAGEKAAAEEREARGLAMTARTTLGNAQRVAADASRALKDLQKDLADRKERREQAAKATAAVPCSGALDDSSRSACSALAGHFHTIADCDAAIAKIQGAIPGADSARSESDQAVGIFETEDAAAVKALEEASARAEAVRREYGKLQSQLKDLKARDRSADLDRAEAQAAGLRDACDKAKADLAEAQADVDAIKAALGDFDQRDLDRAKAAVREKAGEIQTIDGRLSQVTSDLAALDARIRAARKALDKADELRRLIEPAEREIADWKFLARGFGREGVQALELDAAGPRVSELANELLRDAYGPRFEIRFETQAAKADGKGVKETFDIVVCDSERGREGNGEDLSGGEKVIVGEALGLAVGLFHAQSSGVEIGTIVRDETVGALDPENGRRYVAMLRRFIQIGRVHQLLYVCHSPELVDLADAVVRVDNGKILVS